MVAALGAEVIAPDLFDNILKTKKVSMKNGIFFPLQSVSHYILGS